MPWLRPPPSVGLMDGAQKRKRGQGTIFGFGCPSFFRPELGGGPRTLDKPLPRHRTTGLDDRNRHSARAGIKLGNRSLTPLPLALPAFRGAAG